MHAIVLAAERAVLQDHVALALRIEVRGGRVVAVDHQPAPADAVPVRGTLLPGLVDLQVNGGGGRSVDEAVPEALDRTAEAVFAGGAVAFLPTLITAPWEQLIDQVAAVARWIRSFALHSEDRRAEPLGLHVEGPFLEVAGAHDAAQFVDPTPARVERLLEAADGTLRLVTLAPGRDGATAAVERLRARGVTVSIGHARSTGAMTACVDAGAAMVTHLFNAMSPIHHREPGVAGTALDDARLSCGLIADGAHVHPAVLRTAFAALGVDRTVLVSDATSALGMPDGDYELAGHRVRSAGGVVRDASGNLAGSALAMGRAVRNWLDWVPRSGPWTIGRIAAANPARLVGAADHGVIRPGARAAFTLLGADGTIRAFRPS